MAVAVTAAHGVVIALGNDDGPPETFAPIIGVHNGPNGPGFSPNLIQARHHGSEDTFNKVSTVEKTPVTFDLYYDSNDETHAAIITAARTGARKTFRITATDTGTEVYLFEAFVGASFSANVDGFNVYSITLTIDGGVTVS